MIDLAKGAQRKVEDIALTRYASYLIAQNGDTIKNEVAFAHTYFAIQTHKQDKLKIDKIISKKQSNNCAD